MKFQKAFPRKKRTLSQIKSVDHPGVSIFVCYYDAIQTALTEASKTVRNIDSVFVKDIKAHVKSNKVTSYGVICKISFRLD